MAPLRIVTAYYESMVVPASSKEFRVRDENYVVERSRFGVLRIDTYMRHEVSVGFQKCRHLPKKPKMRFWYGATQLIGNVTSGHANVRSDDRTAARAEEVGE